MQGTEFLTKFALKKLGQSLIQQYIIKKEDIRDSSAFFKHIQNAHEGAFERKPFEELSNVEIVRAYSKPYTRKTEEGVFMINIQGELLNSKTEWHQPKLIRTTVHTGGAEMAGGRIVSFPVDGAPGLLPLIRAPGPPLHTGGLDPQNNGGRGPQNRRSSRISGRQINYLVQVQFLQYVSLCTAECSQLIDKALGRNRLNKSQLSRLPYTQQTDPTDFQIFLNFTK